MYAMLSGGSLAQLIIIGLLGFGLAVRSRYHTCELECNPPHQTPRAAAYGFFRGYPIGQSHYGRCPVFAREHR